MATFLSYLAFWQDILDHCRSAEVKQTLLDHFQVLFLQQLLYPSILQSSDTDAGSSVAVLTYMTAMLESLEYPDLINNMLIYLLAIPEKHPMRAAAIPTDDETKSRPSRSPSALKRRQSLMVLNGPANAEDVVEPTLFNLVDLVINNIASLNSQSVFSALQLATTLITRQKRYAFGTLIKVDKLKSPQAVRTVGVLAAELDQYRQMALSLYSNSDIDHIYSGLCDDVRVTLRSSSPTSTPPLSEQARKKFTAKWPAMFCPPAIRCCKQSAVFCATSTRTAWMSISR